MDATRITELPLAELLRRARDEVTDGPSRPQPHLVELHRRGTREIFAAAARACESDTIDERIFGLKLLRELGGPPPRFADEAVPLLLGLLARERSPDVIAWIVSAIGYQHMSGHRGSRLRPGPAVLPAVIGLAGHADARVRFHVAAALPSLVNLAAPEPPAVAALLELAGDSDADTRYYALSTLVDDLGLGDRSDVDAALVQRLADPDPQIRRAAQRALDGGSWAE
ncbi:HEAT repeat-containing protein [Nannocystis exedens]|uniref:HEAT repeat-containing protein n=1 Tax=Nannocystis exedens TaxID=54 RepID=A0A1I1Y4B0_9BACT|nr:HEAT repeat domain-containing protein [Nannocystis exedens]PCC71804.1 putative lyase [Nannocystis exedens]SFE14401.1 HEAT repeat-containing protein [Nannocystis exedens]